VPEEEVVAQTRAGKQVLNVKDKALAAVCKPVEGDHVAVVSKNGKFLVFPVAELPEMTRGKGVRIQKYKTVRGRQGMLELDGGLSDITTFDLAKGLSWTMGGGKTRTETDLSEWIARAGERRQAPAARLPQGHEVRLRHGGGRPHRLRRKPRAALPARARTGLLTVLTLGIYRFWMKTRLRRYYWSSVRPGGHPLEYVGEPMEKLLGFLIAVVALAFYIGIVNLILMYLSFALLHGNVTAYALSFVGVIPIWFYAMYRARRYVLARTRWRGLRFGVDPGAWGYAGRALLHWAITILSLGLLWPRMTFWLEKYKIDRTWLGNQRLHQGGRWQMLYRRSCRSFCAAGLRAGSVSGSLESGTLPRLPHGPAGSGFFRRSSTTRPVRAPSRQPPDRRPPRPRQPRTPACSASTRAATR
jgi:hypothetical protein